MKTLFLGFVAALLIITGVMSVPSASAREPVPTGTDLDYQLGGPVERPDTVGVMVRDRTESPAVGRYNICYVNAFQTQPDAKRFWRQREGLLLQRRGRVVVDGQWGEWLLDVGNRSKRQRLIRIIGPWIDGCAEAGFDAVEFDNLDSFTRSHRLLERRDGLAFARMLVRRAHRADLSAGQKNLAGYDGTQIGFDFAISEQCARYDECARYVEDFGDQVVMIEYRDQDFTDACRDFGATHAIVRRDQSLEPSYEPRYC